MYYLCELLKRKRIVCSVVCFVFTFCSKKKHFQGKIIVITVEFSVVQTACLVEEASGCLSFKFIQNDLRNK